MEENKIVIYQVEDGQTRIDVRLENDTVWLTTSQMAILFDREESNIRRHVINVFKEGELVRENNVQKLHVNGVKKPVPFYNLDVIISVGYRVKSKRGTAFRIWANKILKDYLVKGYAVNDRIRRDQICELRQLIQVVGRAIEHQPLISTEENKALFEVVTDYTYALDTLDWLIGIFLRCLNILRYFAIFSHNSSFSWFEPLLFYHHHREAWMISFRQLPVSLGRHDKHRFVWL